MTYSTPACRSTSSAASSTSSGTRPQHTYQVLTKRSSRLPRVANQLDWPANLWMGVSIENEEHLYRVEHLREVPAAVRFLSCEPLLGPLPNLELSGIDWVITGGESGPGARPLDLIGCARSATSAERPTCPSSTSNGGGRTPKAGGRTLDGVTWSEMPRPQRASA